MDARSEKTSHNKQSPVERAAAFIVDKRKAFYLVYLGLAVFCAVAGGWVHVNNDITTYLPDATETRQGLTLMEDEFTTFGTNGILVDNVSLAQAQALADQVSAVPGVKEVVFDDSRDHYQNASALLSLTYDAEAGDAVSLNALTQVKKTLAGYDAYYTGDVGSSESESIAQEMQVVMVIAVGIICLVLLFTSHTYMEIPVLLLTFGMAALLNMGTNFLFGTISFVSNSIAVVLQLALAIDYAIILCHRYTEERLTQEPREAVIAALSKAIPEISGSSLTTLSGLLAMTFMQFRIGYDMGVVLMKAIVLSLVSVFTLMPGLLVSFSALIDRTHHKSFVPKIDLWGKFVYRTRFIAPPIFVAVLLAAFVLSNKCPYVYGYSTLTTHTQNDSQIAAQKVTETFGATNQMAVLVPTGDYEREGRLSRALESLPQVAGVTSLSNTEAMDGYMLTDRLTPRQFAELTDLDVEVARLLYSAYAVDQETYGQLVSGLEHYGVPLIDMFLFLHQQMDEGYVTLDADLTGEIDDLYVQLTDAQLQLKGPNYSRLVLELNLPEESQETFDFLSTLHHTAARYYPENVYVVGDSTSDYDLSASFVKDNLMISVLTIVFVILVLIFTFQSAGLPVLLILVIQGSIWINFSFPYLQSQNLFFLSYLIVSSIQMGANIDYAIVITNRYTEFKTKLPLRDAATAALNAAFPTIITSGTILAMAGLLIGRLSSDPAISSIGSCLGRGTILSIALVMGILPQILILGDVLIEKTAFTLKHKGILQSGAGTLRISGHVRGYVSGIVDAEFNGTLIGSFNANVEAGAVHPEKLALAEPAEAALPEAAPETRQTRREADHD